MTGPKNATSAVPLPIWKKSLCTANKEKGKANPARKQIALNSEEWTVTQTTKGDITKDNSSYHNKQSPHPSSGFPARYDDSLFNMVNDFGYALSLPRYGITDSDSHSAVMPKDPQSSDASRKKTMDLPLSGETNQTKARASACTPDSAKSTGSTESTESTGSTGSTRSTNSGYLISNCHTPVGSGSQIVTAALTTSSTQKTSVQQVTKSVSTSASMSKRVNNEVFRITDTKEHDGQGMTDLHNQIRAGNIGLVRRILGFADGQVNSPNSLGFYPIHTAVHKNYTDIVKMLINNGADVNCKVENNYGATPLHIAIKKGSCSMVTLLVDNGANVTLTNTEGKTPLEWATMKDRSDLVEAAMASLEVTTECRQ